MRAEGIPCTYWNGDKTMRHVQATGNTKSINHALNTALQRRQDEQRKADSFIPSHEFVGAEMPLPRAVRQLVTEKLQREVKL